ncbi:Dyp-type peroxidase [Kitasatospora viridis]|uniref:Putative iron-dependent peroxidase n=1 Tax=Kitasatospora viridis TaxID=281105 RepID=A0A561TTW3_9ACTN|nr:Dyp-type peroxidase [Kitasatospora viridis]TWF90550.1 putative iron-dependent peroxidase [Kitasatospora viridis]
MTTGAADAARAVLAPQTRAARFLVLTVRPGGEAAVRELLPDLAGLRRSVGLRADRARLSCVTGLGSELWDRLFDGPRPAGLHPFQELRGPRHTAPATPGDLLFHLRAERPDACFELAGQLLGRLAGAADVVDETVGFEYFERRDLTGFVDGTENPEGAAAERAALIGAEDPRFAGGSYAVVQKYRHLLPEWEALTTEQQERAIGRTKLADIELVGKEQPADSHVSLTSLDPDADGRAQEILRHNMPYGSYLDGDIGTYFIGYCRTPAITEEMLRNMFLGRGEAPHDRLLDFTTATTGGLFFVPPADLLDDPPPPTAERPRPRTDWSLGIGSLKRPHETRPDEGDPTR